MNEKIDWSNLKSWRIEIWCSISSLDFEILREIEIRNEQFLKIKYDFMIAYFESI